MAKITFSIDTRNIDKAGLVPIKANICINYKTTSKIVGKIHPENWNKGVVVPIDKRNKKYKELKELSDKLEKLQFNSKEYFQRLEKEQVEITLKIAKDYLDGKEYSKTKKLDFWAAYDEFLKASELDVAKNTTKSRKTTYNKLKLFEQETSTLLSFDKIDLSFFDALNEFILIDQEHEYNDFAATIKRLKAFMNWSFERGYHLNLAFKKFSAPEKEPTIIKLTWNELETLLYFKFDKPDYQKSRDFFCAGCLTGLRFGDLHRLTKDNITADKKHLELTLEKTKIEVSIAIVPALQTIIDRYAGQYRLLPKYENQSINRNLKLICEAAGINTPTEIKKHDKNGTTLSFFPKYDVITTHTGRKTFINLAHKNGMDLEYIKKVTGIQQEKTLKRYLDIDKESSDSKMHTVFGGL